MTVTQSNAQRSAIESPLGPLLVVAGPGAGKTHCLIGRIEYLITTNSVPPERICALTFTNKAAEEMAVRLRRTLGTAANDITCCTIHSLSLQILREFGHIGGLWRGFGVADDDYQRTVLRRLGVPPRQIPEALTLFGRHRLQGHALADRDAALFSDYLGELRKQHLVDFDDLVARTRRLFTDHPTVAQTVRVRWDHVLVDEFQDLNHAQYEVVAALGSSHGRVFAVGDDDQSIFSWAGADPTVLTRFQEDWSIAEPVVLDENRRCSRQIFAAARRLLSENPSLFDKRLVASRDSEFAVAAFAFPDESVEANWILQDMQVDRAAHGTSWGDYGILYRQHRIGLGLERRLMAGGTPCRLAHGRALLDDPVVKYTVASLRLMISPEDPTAVEAVAGRLLPSDLLDRARASFPEGDLPTALRSYARRRSRDHPDSKKAWRFIYHLENLAALWRAHTSLRALIDDLLSQRIGKYRNPLEEHADELTDPADDPDVVHLTRRLREVVERGDRVSVTPNKGLEFAVRRMLEGAGISTTLLNAPGRPAEHEVVLDQEAMADPMLPVRLFKALQLLRADDVTDLFSEYITFDLETTDRDVHACEIVEIGAARIRNGEIVDQFRSLVACDRVISVRAREIHGYSRDDLVSAPPFGDIWPEFRSFVGTAILVAHNAQKFDVPVLKRVAAGLPGIDDLVFYDTLPLARSLFRESARLEDLAERFAIDVGRAHHALDDAITLGRVTERLGKARMARSRKATMSNLLDYLGLALALRDSSQPGTEEDGVLARLATPYTLGRYSDCLDLYAASHRDLDAEAPEPAEVIERLGGVDLMERIRAERKASQRYPASMARLQTLIDSSVTSTLEGSVRRFLESVTLSTSDGVEVDPHRVNLLTLHSTKGLEFSRVYVVGVEDYQLPGYYASVDDLEDETQEARRLLYVGMTRAKDRLVMTYADNRFGLPSGGHRFLDEIGVRIERPVPRS